MIRRPSLILALSAVVLAGCAGVAPVQSGPGRTTARLSAREAASDLYPLEAGCRWDYRLLQRQDDGPVREKPMWIAVKSRAEVEPGVTEAVLERRYESWAPPLTRARRYADRVVLSRLSDPVDGPSITILKFPLAAGASWPGRPLEGGHTETIVPKGREAVEVPAGRYTAERVDHEIRYATGGTDTLSYWYAPGVGVIKMIERSTIDLGGQLSHLEVTGELTRYTAPQTR